MDILHATSASDLGVLALGLVIAGAVGGLAAGVLGIGGGIVVVPVLYHVMTALGVDASVRMHVAIGTSLAAILPAAGLRAASGRDDIDWPLVKRWTAPMLAGVVAGSALVAWASGRALVLVFAAVALPVISYLTFGSAKDRRAAWLTGNLDGFALPTLVGGLSAMTGIGGSTLGAPVLGSRGLPAARATATAPVLTLAISPPAILGAILAGRRALDLPPDSFGYVNLAAFALTAPVLLLAEPAGAWLAHMIDLKRLRFVFAAFIAIATARMLWDALA